MHKTFLMSFSDKRDDRRTDGQRYNGTDRHTFTPLDKRYSPIISSICGPNKGYRPLQILRNYIYSKLFFSSYR